MRYRLLQYSDARTDWQPMYVLEQYMDGSLLASSEGERLLFHTIRDAVYWVRDHLPNASIEYAAILGR